MFRHSVFFAFSRPFGARGEAAPLRASPELGANVAMSDATGASSPTTFALLGFDESFGEKRCRDERSGTLDENPEGHSLAPSVFILYRSCAAVSDTDFRNDGSKALQKDVSCS